MKYGFHVVFFNYLSVYTRIYLKKYQSSFALTFSSSVFNAAPSCSESTINSSCSLLILAVVASRMVMPLWVSDITVSLLSSAEVALFTSFFNSSLSMILGTLEFFSIIRQAMFFTHSCSGCLPFKMRNTLYCSWVRPNSFNSLLVTVFSHQAVYNMFNPAFCTSPLNLVLCMACSNFTRQMYVHTSNFPNLIFSLLNHPLITNMILPSITGARLRNDIFHSIDLQIVMWLNVTNV